VKNMSFASLVEIAENLVGQIIRFCKSSQLIANSSRGQLRYRMQASLSAIEQSTHIPSLKSDLAVSDALEPICRRIQRVVSREHDRQRSRTSLFIHLSSRWVAALREVNDETLSIRVTGYRGRESTTVRDRFGCLGWLCRAYGGAAISTRPRRLATMCGTH
jgi:hypothetical protein